MIKLIDCLFIMNKIEQVLALLFRYLPILYSVCGNSFLIFYFLTIVFLSIVLFRCRQNVFITDSLLGECLRTWLQSGGRGLKFRRARVNFILHLCLQFVEEQQYRPGESQPFKKHSLKWFQPLIGNQICIRYFLFPISLL